MLEITQTGRASVAAAAKGSRAQGESEAIPVDIRIHQFPSGRWAYTILDTDGQHLASGHSYPSLASVVEQINQSEPDILEVVSVR